MPPQHLNISINGNNVTFTWSLPSTPISSTYVDIRTKNGAVYNHSYVPYPNSSYAVYLQSCNEYRLYIDYKPKIGRLNSLSEMTQKTFWVTDNTVFAYINNDVNITWSTTLKKFYDVISPSEKVVYSVQDEIETSCNTTKDNSFSANTTTCISISLRNVSKHDAGIFKTVSKDGKLNGCSLLIIMDKPEKPTLTFDSHPFVDFPTVFTCTSKVQRWPESISSSIYYNFAVGGEQQGNTLTINITRADKDKQIYCRATDDHGRSSDFSNTITIDPYYGPENASLDPPRKFMNVTEGEGIRLVCHADCYPNCTYLWKRKRATIADASILEIKSIYRNHSGIYQCRVIHQNNYSNGTERLSVVKIKVNVLYSPKFGQIEYSIEYSSFQPYVKPIEYYEGKNVDIRMQIDSNPASNLSISSYNYPPTNLEYNKSNVSYTSRLPAIICEKSNNYTITAGNNIGKSDNVTVQLIVKCGPKDIMVVPEIIGTQIGREENITIFVTSNPKPTVEWTNRTNQSWSVCSTEVKYKYRCFSAVLITDESMFGQYGLQICNTLNKLNCTPLTITISPKDKPQQPRNFTSIEISSNWANVSWEAGFDGGEKQSFTIEYKRSNENTWTTVEIYSSDTNKGTQQFYTLTGLLPETSYDIIVLANNSFGTSNASLHLVTNAAPDLTTSAGHNRYIVIAAGGGVLGLIICIGIVAVLLKRRQNAQENSPEPENTEYAVVVKQKSNKESQNVQDNSQTAEYAAIVKPKSKKASSKVKFVNTEYAVVEKSNQHNDITEETEYANEGDQQLHLQNIGRKQNKEGLIYLEVTFSNDTSNRPVVRDPYQKTDYVDIDFTRKAEMLPEDSD